MHACKHIHIAMQLMIILCLLLAITLLCQLCSIPTSPISRDLRYLTYSLQNKVHMHTKYFTYSYVCMCTYNRHATSKIGYTLMVNYQVIPPGNPSEIPTSPCMNGDYIIILVHHQDVLINIHNAQYVCGSMYWVYYMYFVTFSDQLLHFCAHTHSRESCKSFFARQHRVDVSIKVSMQVGNSQYRP